MSCGATKDIRTATSRGGRSASPSECNGKASEEHDPEQEDQHASGGQQDKVRFDVLSVRACMLTQPRSYMIGKQSAETLVDLITGVMQRKSLSPKKCEKFINLSESIVVEEDHTDVLGT